MLEDFKSIQIKFKVLNLFFEASFDLDPDYIKYLLRFGRAQQHLPQVQGFLSQENTVVSGAGPFCGVNSPMNWELSTSLTSLSTLRSRRVFIYFYPRKKSIPTKILSKQGTLLSTLHSLQTGSEDKHMTDGRYNA